MKKLFLTIVLYLSALFGAVHVYAQEAVVAASPSAETDIFKLAYNNILLLLAVFVLIGVILAGLNLIWALIDIQRMKLLEQYGPEVLEKANLSASGTLWDKISQKSWNLVPLEKEQDIDLGHDFDGIRELDNSLPPWWLWLFYITIIWSVAYLYYYHVSDTSLNQEQEYIAAMELGEAEKAKYLSLQADAVDEKTVTALTDDKAVSEGKEIYVANCLVCHGEKGEGLVGPNFTDKYWIHGGSINNIFSVIKYGVPEKGMISWKSQLQPAAMQKVASYILAFQGTNPPNQKEAQGTLFNSEVTAVDSNAVGAIISNPDSTVNTAVK